MNGAPRLRLTSWPAFETGGRVAQQRTTLGPRPLNGPLTRLDTDVIAGSQVSQNMSPETFAARMANAGAIAAPLMDYPGRKEHLARERKRLTNGRLYPGHDAPQAGTCMVTPEPRVWKRS